MKSARLLNLLYYSLVEALPDPWKCGVGMEDSSLVVESREDIRLWEEGVERPDLLGAPAQPHATNCSFPAQVHKLMCDAGS
jgi:hypothetical protein